MNKQLTITCFCFCIEIKIFYTSYNAYIPVILAKFVYQIEHCKLVLNHLRLYHA